ncbi:hypothetical protein BB559_003676 [Furculomyces boomerangus]|uniref:Uncharacterized protein n=1 Tax=Furculomyces boomerangus TaxID=61424 RepID=A0A2T9YJL2_9FUNG|nr:hypothetical protein BB559_003676 [Furculomyces boomerangus]
MGKKDKQKNGLESLANRELYERMSFLYQASQLLTLVNFEKSISTNKKRKLELVDIPKKKKKKRKASKPPKELVLESKPTKKIILESKPTKEIILESKPTKEIKLETILEKIDPSIKRTVCKKCKATLFPAITSSTQIKEYVFGSFTETTCLRCGYIKRLLNNPKHKLFSEQFQHVVKTIITNEKHKA